MNDQQHTHHYRLVITLVVVVLLAAAYILFTLTRDPDTAATTNTQATGGAVLSLSPTTRSVPVGQTFTVDIILDTDGTDIYGVDITKLRFDPQVFQVVDADTQTAGVQIKPGGLMDMVAANTVDNTAGTVQFSQIASIGSTYKGAGTLATVVFRALKAGTSEVTIDFAPGSSVDTNVAAARGDILSGVTGGSYVSTP